ncbi:peroxiredoxin-6-like [Artemia franciscana]|uniref:1-Cys peroxiredoxin n=1 Tax=Artemia franciscana TaxID=6661 RepID=A0AA88HLU6_ARTSF|nr:hypothetical protein QYM36_009437 [Artemia franciscana]KAK2713558.1 hypothetical protein QYM36_009437 [Artemia franciscana]
MKLGQTFPDFKADTSHGPISFHEWIGDSWAILFSHPADYTPVCTTELTRVAKLMPEFQKRNVKVIALSIDSTESHKGWIKDIQCFGKTAGDFPYPIIADTDRSLGTNLGIIDPDEVNKEGVALTARAVFVIGPDKKMKLSILYPATTGRNFDEILRVIDSLQLTAVKKVATPADWKPGMKCMVVPSVPDEELPKMFPQGVEIIDVPSKKSYLRMVENP